MAAIAITAAITKATKKGSFFMIVSLRSQRWKLLYPDQLHQDVVLSRTVLRERRIKARQCCEEVVQARMELSLVFVQQLEAGMNVKDLVDIFDVVAYGVDAYKQLVRDQFVAHAANDTFENFFLPVGQTLIIGFR